MPRHSFLLLMLAVGLLHNAPEMLAQQEPAASSPVFEFHSGFWVNLHDFLYLQGRMRTAAARGASPEAKAPEQDGGLDASRDTVENDLPYSGAASEMTPNQRKAWDVAVALYASDMSSRDLILNSNMVLINERLAEMENCPELLEKGDPECISGLRPELTAALNEAAPVYRAHWWAEQDRENRAWIAAVAPLVREMGNHLSEQLTGVYQRNWPGSPFRVDVVGYSGSLGAYTSLEPMHITISSHDPRNQGWSALVVLFNEASYSLAEALDRAIARDCREAGKPIPRDLWPALLLYTTGEMLRRALSAGGNGDTSLTPGESLVSMSSSLRSYGWSGYQDMLDRYWQPYLAGNLGFDAAIARIVASL